MALWLPLVYGAALLAVSVLGSLYGLTGRELAGLIVAVTGVYLVWLALYLVPFARRRFFRRTHGD